MIIGTVEKISGRLSKTQWVSAAFEKLENSAKFENG